MSEESRRRRLFNQQQSIQIQASRTQFIGPLPPPDVLVRYNDAVPNAAERIIAMAESQLHHRQTLEAQVIDSNCKAQQRGPIYGLTVCMMAIAGGVYLISTGKNASGLAAIISALAGVVVVFVAGKIVQKRELGQKSEALVAPPPKQK